MFKFFDMPKKEQGEGLNTADWFYIIKLIVVTNGALFSHFNNSGSPAFTGASYSPNG